MGTWIGEENADLGILLKVRAEKILYKGSSRNFNEIIVGKTRLFGSVLVLKENKNYTFQIAEKWDSYSEMLVHVPMCAHPNPKRILIIGGGDGSSLREVIKHETVEEIFLVDIDEKIVNLGKNILGVDKGAFSDPRVNVIIGNAYEFIKGYSGEKFDIVIGDYSDPYRGTPAEILIQEDFFKSLKKISSPNSILCLQSGSPMFQQDILKTIYLHLKALFKNTYIYVSVVPFYPGGIWSFTTASDVHDPRHPIREITNTFFYNKEIHTSAFSLPTFLRTLLDTDS